MNNLVSVNAQRTKSLNLKNNKNIYSTIGIGVGGSNYFGDLNNLKYLMPTILKMSRWNISANYIRQFNNKFAGRAAFSYARISGDDENFNNTSDKYLINYSRGLHFRNDLKELSVSGIYNIIPFTKSSFYKRPKITPFIFCGIAIANHNPQAREIANQVSGVISKKWINLRTKITESQYRNGQNQYSNIVFSIPFGGGIKYKLTQQLDISFEAGLRYTITNGGKYLDDVSGNYIATAGTSISPTESEKYSFRAKEIFNARNGNIRIADKITLPDTEISPGIGSVRGNGDQDLYFLSIISLNYIIPKMSKCVPLR